MSRLNRKRTAVTTKVISAIATTAMLTLVWSFGLPQEVRNADGSWSVRRITDAGNDDSPSVSPNRRYLAFFRATGEQGELAPAYLYLADLRRGRTRRLAGLEAAIEQDGRPIWSPRSDRIYFSAAGALWRFNIRTSSITRLTPVGTDAFCPSLSPDGTQLAFWSWTRRRVDKDLSLSLLNLLTGRQRVLGYYTYTAETEIMWVPPLWHEKGDRLAIVLPGGSGDNCPENFELVLVDVKKKLAKVVDRCAQPIKFDGTMIYYVGGFYSDVHKELISFDFEKQTKLASVLLPSEINGVTLTGWKTLVYGTGHELVETDLGGHAISKVADFGDSPYWDERAGVLVFTKVLSDKHGTKTEFYIAQRRPP